MKKLVLLLTILLSVITGYSQQILYETIMHDGIEREYILYIPADYNGNVSVPLIFNFHGYGSNADEQMAYGDFRPIADTAGFIIVHPQGTLFNGIPHWNVGGWTIGSTVDDVGFTESMIDSISMDYNIDSLRIYSTGMSNGGYMSFLLACQLNHRIAAIASVTGSMTPETYTFCNPVHPTPILQFHGTNDLVVPYGGALWSQSIDLVIAYWVTYNSCNIIPTITNLPDLDPNDGSTVTHYAYEDGIDDVVTEHFKIIGGGHTWPGSQFGGAGTNYDIDASTEIWNFFRRFELLNGILSVENNSTLDFKIFPNPTKSTITIESDMGVLAEYSIMTIYGEVIRNGMINTSYHTEDVSKLPPNMYLIKIGNQTSKIIITR